MPFIHSDGEAGVVDHVVGHSSSVTAHVELKGEPIEGRPEVVVSVPQDQADLLVEGFNFSDSKLVSESFNIHLLTGHGPAPVVDTPVNLFERSVVEYRSPQLGRRELKRSVHFTVNRTAVPPCPADCPTDRVALTNNRIA
jgi:hypothetical protein